MALTKSELLFENYCNGLMLDLERIPEGSDKTPDYELIISGQRVVVEVKEITRNKEERESDRKLFKTNIGNVLSNTPGDRVRKKIKDSSAQIKARTQGIFPSILILFDRGQVADHLDPYNIRVAMYGLEQIHMANPKNISVSPYITGMSYGPKRNMTEKHNTSISAIGVLFFSESRKIKLNIYHNQYAAIPLGHTLFEEQEIPQFYLEDEVIGTTEKWKKVTVR